MIAAGLDGIERDLPLEPAFEGNAYATDAARVPNSLDGAAELWKRSDWVREVFGAEVQDHYTNMARIEIDAYSRSVTDWERKRSFERM